jgi:SAM-dependent methyltransferase
MTFSPEWDERYRAGTHLSVWPWSDLVSYVMRFARPKSSSECVLEIGCGAGANIPFFRKLGVQYAAIEGSASIVRVLHQTYPDLAQKIFVGDFTVALPGEDFFDLVVDRASLTHNSEAAIRRSLGIIASRMKKGARYIGIDWFSTRHSDYQKGKQAEDAFTRTDIAEGGFKGTGRVHFSDRKHIVDLFHDFNVEVLEEKIVTRSIPDDSHVSATWNFCAVLK